MIPLYQPHMPKLPEMNKILRSGRLAYGAYGREFESQLQAYFGTPNVLVTNTFNMAILVSLKSLYFPVPTKSLDLKVFPAILNSS